MRFDFKTGTFTHMRHAAGLTAVASPNGALSWQSLRAATWDWMRRARSAGVCADKSLAILGCDQPSFVTAVLGCVALGIPYVPLDCRDSVYWIRHRIDIARSSLIYDPLEDRFIVGLTETAPLREAGLASILFTTPAGGDPLGVQIGREGMALLANWLRHGAGFARSPVFMACLPCDHSFSLMTLVGAMELGGTHVTSPSGQDATGAGLAHYLQTHGVTVLGATPAFLCGQLAYPEISGDRLPGLDTLVLACEPASWRQFAELRLRFPRARIINTFGCAELAGLATWGPLDDGLPAQRAGLCPLGSGLRDTHVFVQDDEVCFGGNHVMRGYINAGQLTRDRLFTYKGKRAYRTGMRGAVDDDGVLHWLSAT